MGWFSLTAPPSYGWIDGLILCVSLTSLYDYLCGQSLDVVVIVLCRCD